MRRLLLTLATAAVLAACSAQQPDGAEPTATAIPSAITARLDALDAAVFSWREAATVAEAHAAAEDARNLVVGPTGTLYGDGDGSGSLGVEPATGLLPGLDGSPGLAGPPSLNACVDADVLGGSWEDPQERWDIMLEAIDAWAPGGNTFPSLPSHPQRVVGWATLTLEADDLDLAHEYAGHAQLHVDVTRAAYESCG
ncbi:hypothetical protein [Demequina lignilytica]|uniref:Lipoprotein n=1 Tax=Demequina lignilytica TaxID=3051663 RepID=A0AB35ME09_9MICO|nr:hypothetical protein [Demequina sp. SYSU T0a273]MDN4482004.1 hypothetical protein [Demequina sp. SYSU T0a273]